MPAPAAPTRAAPAKAAGHDFHAVTIRMSTRLLLLMGLLPTAPLLEGPLSLPIRIDASQAVLEHPLTRSQALRIT
jgi:hypothetical protein